jgi:CHAD domain-containing protein
MTRAHREVETRYAVDDTTSLPELAGLPDVASVDGPATIRFEARYFDTPDLDLGHCGITLRRRTGGDDEGWQLLLPREGARQEIRAPLGRSARTPPLALRRVVQGLVRDAAVEPVATLSTERTVLGLLDADGALLAEVRDDRVVAARPGPDGEEEAWREWELAQHGARRRLTKAVDSRIRKAGARPAPHQAGPGHVLQLDPGADRVAPLSRGRRATEHEVLGRQLEGLAADVRRLDPLVRADVPDAVHQLRVVFRRLRSILSVFEKCFDTTLTDPVGADSAWIGDLLGRPRDLEVLRAHLDRLVAAQPPELVRGRIGAWIDSRLRTEHREAHRAAVDAMASERYFALVDTLHAWRDAPPWRDERDRPALKRLPQGLDRAWASTEGAAAAATVAAPGTDRSRDLHDVRKAAKRTRYAAATLAPVLGPGARKRAQAAERIQTVLGDYHDAVVAGAYVVGLADAAHADGRDTFTLGVLCIRLEEEAAGHERAFEQLLHQRFPS